MAAYYPLPSELDEEASSADNPFAAGYVSAANYSGDDDNDADARTKEQLSVAADAASPSASLWGEFCLECCGIRTTDSTEERRRKYGWTAVETSVAVTACFWFEKIIHNKFCNWLFRCGCTWTWAGGWDRCNVFNTQGLPKCPWCTAASNVSWTTDHLLFALMALTFIVLLRLRKRVDASVRWLAPLLVYFGAGTLVGWLFQVTGSYPTFIW